MGYIVFLRFSEKADYRRQLFKIDKLCFEFFRKVYFILCNVS